MVDRERERNFAFVLYRIHEGMREGQGGGRGRKGEKEGEIESKKNKKREKHLNHPQGSVTVASKLFLKTTNECTQRSLSRSFP